MATSSTKTMSFWRIATDAPAYTADDRSGTAAKLTGGRWNEEGVPVLYSSSCRSLACLETVVHLQGYLPLNRYLVEVRVREEDVRDATIFSRSAKANVGWDAEPAGRVSIRWGSDWCRSLDSLVALVPSVIVPEELNVLINPLHPAMKHVRLQKIRRWLYDPRIVQPPAPGPGHVPTKQMLQFGLPPAATGYTGTARARPV